MTTKKKKVSSFVIDRAIWGRGRGDGKGVLLGDDDCRCCVGIYLKACGVPDDVMKGVDTAYKLKFNLPTETAWLKSDRFNSTVNKLYGVNDDLLTDLNIPKETYRESMVQRLFAEENITVTFEGPKSKP